MQTMNRIAAEWLAVADALRQVRQQLCRLLHASHPVATHREATTVLVSGLDAAMALETLAQHLVEE